MTTPAGFLDFFILEASDYLEQLDGLLHSGASATPDADALQRAARALRGAATMAKLPTFADVAAGLERVARGLREGSLPWEPTLGGALTAAVDEMKTLLRATRTWSSSEDERARARSAELSRYAPATTTSPTPAAGSDAMYFAGEASNIAAGLELMAARPEDRDGAANVLRRVRALRGVAGIREMPPLAEIMEAAEHAAKPLELGEAPLSADARDVLAAGSALLRRVASALRDGAAPNAPSDERTRFDSAVERFQVQEGARDRIVPIAELFFDDAGPHLVTEAPNPPSRPAERFRLELVSQGEHLRGFIQEIRQAPDESARERMRREMQRMLRSLVSLAQSFGEDRVAAAINRHAAAAHRLDALTLTALDDLAAALTDRASDGERLTKFVAESERSDAVDAGIGAGFTGAVTPAASPLMPEVAAPAPPAPPAPPARPLTPLSVPITLPPLPEEVAPAPAAASVVHAQPALIETPPAETATPPNGDKLATALDASIAGLESLTSQPLAAPVAIEQPPVPIEALLYRGRAAIVRAIEIRDQIRAAGTPADTATLSELFDLLDLALAG